ncbi:DUF3472 domain-containing protein [Roseateles albus]|uniref:DUF3472 domain-containing protein n=1 Tax=Roseateles albus TaxID=2987525 RepID=A0ABT5K9F9_9BURK|nr:DUF3472 domain-containing protein [Roseateles albus]MDC8770410.1 DUF3472 domain-containing protein [Roseateles albus]
MPQHQAIEPRKPIQTRQPIPAARKFTFSALLLMSLAACGGGNVAEAEAPALAAPAAAAGPTAHALAAPTAAPVKARAPLVALGGNAYITAAGPDTTEWISNEEGLMDWTDPATVISTYVRVAQPGKFNIVLKGSAPAGGVSTLRITALGKSFTQRLNAGTGQVTSLATVDVAQAGYVKIDVQGLKRTGAAFGKLTAIELSGTAATGLQYANAPDDYYWSRRGPSVHLSYAVPANTEYAYSELQIPVGEDPIGSYFMANGFGQGYMGIQVNGPDERRVLFSVWDPEDGGGGGKTTLVKKGPDVVVNEFGGEGTGGQSYLLYPWVAGNTYKFITRVRPDGQGASLYSAWFFAPEDGQWHFIATWTRPNITTWLTDFYAFAENFDGDYGWRERKMLHGQQWAVNKDGSWKELNRARFTVDATGDNKQRLDYAGGVDASGKFFLRNGGFFNETVTAGQYFTRPLTGAKPDVRLDTLP